MGNGEHHDRPWTTPGKKTGDVDRQIQADWVKTEESTESGKVMEEWRKRMTDRWAGRQTDTDRRIWYRNKAVYTTTDVAGGWARAVTPWTGAVMPWAGAVMGDDENVQFLLSSLKVSSFFVRYKNVQ